MIAAIRLHFRRPAQVGQVAAVLALAFTASTRADEKLTPVKPNPAAEAKTEAEMKSYKEPIPGGEVSFEMVPIKGGIFDQGSPKDEAGRADDEGPSHKVKIDPFWMGKFEVTWDEYDVWSFDLDGQRRKIGVVAATELDPKADAVTRPTKPYTDMTFGMGHDGFPAICMTQLAAKTYCQWLSAKTGHYYRLPTEAEWEYACRAGTSTAYSFGDDPEKLDEYAWHEGNGEAVYHKVGLKKPNPWGLYDMHGNVAEWTLDAYDPAFYAKFPADKPAEFPYNIPDKEKEYPRSARGGSWMQPAAQLRSAARLPSTPDWKQQDPQRPRSIWYLTDALHVGFRLVRPLRVPEVKERKMLNFDPERSNRDGLKE